ncbi:MAG: hypothetical protein IAE79_12710 [Anaerolinea sp.]|nr:hypothetical protein [Anaerolinea sp.]
MSETDNPLKLLITQYREAFAAWLLGRPVRHVRPLNVEFPAQGARGDLLFEVIDTQGNLIYLHIELQGPRTAEPMPLRQLDYLTRTVRRDIGVPQGEQTPHLHSVVIYVGDGAGRGDDGYYEVLDLDGATTLSWRYQALRLWEMDAETLFKLGSPAFLALIGQTRLRQPEVILPQAIASIRQVEDAAQKGRLLTALFTLLRDEEVTMMVEKLLDQSEDFLLDTPYLRKMRRIGLEQGLQQGREEGREKGREEGLRAAILDGIALRFNPLATDYRAVEDLLKNIPAYDTLRQLHKALFEVTDFAAFRGRLEQQLGVNE